MAVGRDWIDLMGAVKVISLFRLVMEGRACLFLGRIQSGIRSAAHARAHYFVSR